MGAAPAIVQFVGGTAADALAATRAMGRITVGANAGFAIPALGFSGTPTGIDVRLVEEKNLLPQINTGIPTASRSADRNGFVNLPMACLRRRRRTGGRAVKASASATVVREAPRA
jgi:hypothetical protein